MSFPGNSASLCGLQGRGDQKVTNWITWKQWRFSFPPPKHMEVLPPSICLALALAPSCAALHFDASISCSQNPICPKDVIERTRFCTNPHLIYPFLFPLASLICFSPLWVPLTIWSHDKAPARSPAKKNWCCWEPLKAHGVLGAFFGPFILGFYKIDPIQVLNRSFAMLGENHIQGS